MEKEDDRPDDDSAVFSAVPRTMEATGTTAAAANAAVSGLRTTDSSRSWSPQHEHGTTELAKWRQPTSIGSRVRMMIAVGGKATRPQLVAYVVFRHRRRRRRVAFCKILIEIDIVPFICAEWL